MIDETNAAGFNALLEASLEMFPQEDKRARAEDLICINSCQIDVSPNQIKLIQIKL